MIAGKQQIMAKKLYVTEHLFFGEIYRQNVNLQFL